MISKSNKETKQRQWLVFLTLQTAYQNPLIPETQDLGLKKPIQENLISSVTSVMSASAISPHPPPVTNYPSDCQQQLITKYKPNTRVASELLKSRFPELTWYGKRWKVLGN